MKEDATECGVYFGPSGIPCSEGLEACAGQPETVSTGDKVYCCSSALHALNVHTHNGQTVCTCVVLP